MLSVEYETDDHLLVGTVIGINNFNSFHGRSMKELKRKFAVSIEDCLEMCEQGGKRCRKQDLDYVTTQQRSGRGIQSELSIC